MASMAIDTAYLETADVAVTPRLVEVGYPLPPKQPSDGSLAHFRGRLPDKTVRDRNACAGRPWWQPSSPRKKFRKPRAAALAAAIQEELDKPELEAPPFGSAPHEEQETARWWLDRQRQNEALNGVCLDLELELQEQAQRKLSILGNPRFRQAEIDILAQDPEVGNYLTASMLEEVVGIAEMQLAIV